MNEQKFKSKIVINVETVHRDLLERKLGMSLSKYLENVVSNNFDSIIKSIEIKKESNVGKYLDNELLFDKTSIIPLAELFLHYNNWNNKNGNSDVGKNKFCRFLRGLDNVEVKRGGANVMKVYGLKINEDELW